MQEQSSDKYGFAPMSSTEGVMDIGSTIEALVGEMSLSEQATERNGIVAVRGNDRDSNAGNSINSNSNSNNSNNNNSCNNSNSTIVNKSIHLNIPQGNNSDAKVLQELNFQNIGNNDESTGNGNDIPEKMENPSSKVASFIPREDNTLYTTCDEVGVLADSNICDKSDSVYEKNSLVLDPGTGVKHAGCACEIRHVIEYNAIVKMIRKMEADKQGGADDAENKSNGLRDDEVPNRFPVGEDDDDDDDEDENCSCCCECCAEQETLYFEDNELDYDPDEFYSPCEDSSSHDNFAVTERKICEDDLSFSIEVKVDKPTQRLAPNLLNVKCLPGSQIVDIFAHTMFNERKFPELKNVNEQKFNTDTIPELLKDWDLVDYNMSLYEFFRQMLYSEKENRQRVESYWFGGVDCHHLFYEGGSPEYGICWGS